MKDRWVRRRFAPSKGRRAANREERTADVQPRTNDIRWRSERHPHHRTLAILAPSSPEQDRRGETSVLTGILGSSRRSLGIRIRWWLIPLACLWPGLLPGQVLMSRGPYYQDFDTLANQGAAIWEDNKTLPGWYASRSAAPIEVPTYRAGAGSSSVGGLYSYGRAASRDRALGSLASGGTGKLAYGVRFTNDTETARTGFTVSFTGEQWRVANASSQRLVFAYQVGLCLTNADARNDQRWTLCPALDFIGSGAGATAALDGNEPSNRVVFTNASLPGVVVPPGQELFLRWFDPDDPGFDSGLAIDQVAVSFGPVNTNAATSGAAFSLLTYNTHGHSVEDWSTNSWQVQAIGRQLIFLKPDIVAFNEIPETNTYQMQNWIDAFLPGYQLATNSASDGYIRNVIASRFPITSSRSRLHDSDLAPYGYTASGFTRDLFEAEISIPQFPRPLHVFSIHLKSAQDGDSSAKRAAEASAISNFFASTWQAMNPLDPYVLCGDLNEDLVRPPARQLQPIQQMTGPATGLQLVTPVNPITGSELTFSIRSESLSRRYDYILPCALLASNIAASEVFRTDLLPGPPPFLRPNDARSASDHLPVLVAFNNPYDRPFRMVLAERNGSNVRLAWESIIGQMYRVESSSNLILWTPLASHLAATGFTTFFATNTGSKFSCFRVGREP